MNKAKMTKSNFKIKYIAHYSILILLVILNLIFLPSIIHFFSLENIKNSVILSSKEKYYTKLKGNFLIEYGKVYNDIYYVPVIIDSNSEDDIRIIASFNSLNSEEIKKSVEYNYANGYYRNVLWEKKANEEIQELFSDSDLNLSNKIIVFDTFPKDDNIVFLLIFDAIVLILFIIIDSKKGVFFKRNK